MFTKSRVMHYVSHRTHTAFFQSKSCLCYIFPGVWNQPHQMIPPYSTVIRSFSDLTPKFRSKIEDTRATEPKLKRDKQSNKIIGVIDEIASDSKYTCVESIHILYVKRKKKK